MKIIEIIWGFKVPIIATSGVKIAEWLDNQVGDWTLRVALIYTIVKTLNEGLNFLKNLKERKTPKSGEKNGKK